MNHLQDLVHISHVLVDMHFSRGTSGNVSIRSEDRFMISLSGSQLGKLDETSFVPLSIATGEVLGSGNPSKEHALHRAFYEKNPAAQCVIHVHSPYAAAWSCMKPWQQNHAIPPMTPYVFLRAGQVPLLPYHQPGDAAMRDDVLTSPFHFTAALMANHGVVVSGTTPAEALDTLIEIEEACRIALLTYNHDARLLDNNQIQDLISSSNHFWDIDV
ncbi:MAG: class II aldolase/adducin family protein [Actinomycetaceae bacterium]|nr:class II aldolase/adducin family protein [Actinomycetaceae bacterium]MDY6082244.1 class II aldolase/adducin family protein [Actinomycetaceae bacterium]